MSTQDTRGRIVTVVGPVNAPGVDRPPHVGDMATLCFASDQYAAEVVQVSPTGKTIVIRQMRAKLVEGDIQSERQVYRFESNRGGEVYSARWSERIGAYRTMSGTRVVVGVAQHYREPSI